MYMFYAVSVNPPQCCSSFHSLSDSYVGSTPNTKNVSLEQQYLQRDEDRPLYSAESGIVLYIWKNNSRINSGFKCLAFAGYSHLKGHFAKFQIFLALI